jgi:ankyrin repeat protein
MRISGYFQTALLLLLACSVVMPLSAQAAQESRPAIYQAIINDSVAKVQAAIDSGADVNAVWEQDTPLCFALAYGDRWEVAKAIIQAPRVDVNKRGIYEDGFANTRERTPLLIAAEIGPTEIVDLLLKKGADINARDSTNGAPLSQGNSPLILAAAMNRLDTVQRLLAHTKKPDILLREMEGKTAFWFAVANENLEMTKLLLSQGSKINLPDKSGASVLTTTVLHKKYEVLDFLIAKGVDINMADQSGSTPLMAAIGLQGKNRPVVLKYLEKFLTFKPKVNHQAGDDSALHMAAFFGFGDAVKLLLANGADINLQSRASGRTPLYVTAISKNIDTAKLLMKEGAKTEIADKAGYTPLTAAVIVADPDMVRTLVEGGAVMDVRTAASNLTPLVMAATNPDPFKHKTYLTIMKYLLGRKADVNFPSLDGRTPLIAAAMNADQAQALEKAALLLDGGAKPDLVKHGGETALMLAAGRGNGKVVELLIEKGADVSLKNGAGESAMSYARRSGNNAIIALLESKGAKSDAPLVMKPVTVKELFGTWEGFQDGMPQALFKLALDKDGKFDFVSRLTPEVLKTLPKGSVNPVIAAQKGAYTVNNDVLILNLVGAAPVSRKWKLENKVLILDNIIRLKKVK